MLSLIQPIRLSALTGSIVFLALTGATGGADTIYVCWDGSGDYETIQEGLDDPNATEVVVCSGTYTGSSNTELDFAGRAIVLRSETGDPADCTIDGGGTYRAFLFDDGETADAVVRGFTIQNCWAANNGGAVRCESSDPRFFNCLLRQNASDLNAGAVYLDESDARFTTCRFLNNTATYVIGAGGACAASWGSNPHFTNCRFADNSAPYGGGLYLSESNATLLDCVFNDNDAGALGGGLLVDNLSDATVAKCSFTSNTAANGGAVVVFCSDAAFSDGTLDANEAVEDGGAVWIDATDPVSIVSFTNCDMGGNSAGLAGGAVRVLNQCQVSFDGGQIMGNMAKGGSGGAIASTDGSDVTATGCTFLQNFTVQQGGVLFSENGTATATDCQFTGNSANGRGGAIANVAGSVTVTGSTFDGNTTGGAAGAMVNETAAAEIVSCGFTNNIAAERGGALFNAMSPDVVVQDCWFEHNWLTGPTGRGGAISNGQSPATVERCHFRLNDAPAGGGIHNALSDAVIRDCNFEENSGSGGGIFNGGSSPLISWCQFVQNTTTGTGGGIHNTAAPGPCQPVIHNCAFFGNEAVDAGAGVHCDDGSVVELANCLFSGNSVTWTGGGGSGGGIRAEASNVTAVNCTLSRNHADADGGGVSSIDGALITLLNSVLWENEDSTGITFGAQVHTDTGGNVTADWCCVYDWPGGGTGNIDCHANDPDFSDPDGGDGNVGTPDDNLHLLTSSPCVDGANNTVVPADATDLDGDFDWGERTPLDLDAKQRFIDDSTVVDSGVADPPDYLEVVDMGSYERCPGDIDGDGDTDHGDLGELLAAWDTVPGDPGWNEDADLDGNGHVHQSDLGVVLADWGCGA